MKTTNDFGELKLPADLVRKLEYDLDRMVASGSDQYAAFDFFVTADSIVDWIYPEIYNDKAATEKQKKKQGELRKANVLLRIASHIANRAKHFVVTRHNSVTGIEKSRYVAKEYVADGYFNDPLLVHLTMDEATFLGVHEYIEVIQLARLVLQYWSAYEGVS